MSTELSNGVIIPEEYSDDWYDEMSINLRKLNDVITAASDNATDIQRLDTDKANQSDLTALSGRVTQTETDITALQTAVSGALKREIVQTLPTEDISTTTIYMIRNSQSSGTNIYDEYMYINSQWELIGTSATDFSNYYTKNETDTLLSDKADDSDVVHKAGSETIEGIKDFSDVLRVYNSNSSTNTAQMWLKNSKVNRGQSVYGDQAIWFRDATDKQVTALISRVTSLGASALLLYVYNVDQNNQQVINYLSFVKNLDGSCYLLPDKNNVVELGSTSNIWKDLYTNKINSLEPSSLSLPSGNASNFIDISSYFSNTGTGDTNSYTALANGWIYLRLGDISDCQATIFDANNNRMWGQSSTGSVEQITIPILKGQTLTTQWTTESSVNVATARFIPCLGNI